MFLLEMQWLLLVDQTGIQIISVSSWTLDKQGSKRVETTGSGDKRLIIAVFCGSLTGDFLPVIRARLTDVILTTNFHVDDT